MSDSCSFSTWEPVYEAILSDLGFDRSADEAARDVAAEFAQPFDHGRLAHLDGATVAVVGAAPSLSTDLASFDRELTHSGTPVAAHAHGDNIPTLREWLPRFDLGSTLVTTQAEPRGVVENF